jgi:hypothetical protein
MPEVTITDESAALLRELWALGFAVPVVGRRHELLIWYPLTP